MRTKWAVLTCIILSLSLLGGERALSQTASQKGIEGIWSGTLMVPGGLPLRLVATIKRGPNGALVATVASPDQGAGNIPVATTTFAGSVLKLDIAAVKATFEGKLNEAGTEITGEFKQGGGTLPLTLKRVDKEPKPDRPQEPKPPFPYECRDVGYVVPEANVTLAGTLTVPQGKGPFPAALLITGSGPQDRDESLMGHKPFLVLADYLTRRGIAVLRMDDRGVGGSTGKVSDATAEDSVKDVLAGIDYLKHVKEVDPKRIGLIGHSEGGIIGPLVASRSKDVAFVVMMAGTGLPGDEILYLQAAAISRASGATEAAIGINRKLQEGMFAILKQEKDNAAAEQKLTELWEKTKAAMTPEEQKAAAAMDPAIRAQIKQILTPWFRSFLFYDPRPALRLVSAPVLAINGEKDLQVPPKENLKAIEEALKAGGNKDYTVKELRGLNHLFQTARTGSPAEYGSIQETISPVALQTMGDWIVAHVGKAVAPSR